MSIKQTKEVEIVRPANADDLTAIHGIGAGIERRFNSAGILTYHQLESLNPEQIAGMLEGAVGITTSRVVEQDWVGQAKKLSLEKAEKMLSAAASSHEDVRQHYEMFSIELLLDESNQVRRTKIIHSQSQSEVNWAGWDEQRLLFTMIQNSGLRKMPEIKAKMDSHAEGPVQPPETKPEPKKKEEPIAPKVRGELSLKEMEVLIQGMAKPSNILQHEQAYKVNLTLDMSKVNWPEGVPMETPFEYRATVYARNPANLGQLTVGNARGLITQAEKITIQIEGSELPAGIYRLEAVVSLGSPSAQNHPPSSSLLAMLEAGLLQVY
jgi:hypothetical protein